MIDRLRALANAWSRLKPLFLIAAGAAVLVFGYIVLVEQGAEHDAYLIPSIVVLLWSLVCYLLLSVFPHVPPIPDKRLGFSQRLKIRLARGCYHLGAWAWCLLSGAVVLMTIKVLNVWRAEF